MTWGQPAQSKQPAATAAAPLDQLTDEQLGAYTDQLMAGLDAALPELGPEGPDWPLVAEHLNAFLGRTWPAPPWSGDQAATVAMALAQGAAAGG